MSVCNSTSVKDTASSFCPKNRTTVFVNLNEKVLPVTDEDDEISSNNYGTFSSTSGNNYVNHNGDSIITDVAINTATIEDLK